MKHIASLRESTQGFVRHWYGTTNPSKWKPVLLVGPDEYFGYLNDLADMRRYLSIGQAEEPSTIYFENYPIWMVDRPRQPGGLVQPALLPAESKPYIPPLRVCRHCGGTVIAGDENCPRCGAPA